MALGVDGGGSIRIPAASCGNVGVKGSFIFYCSGEFGNRNLCRGSKIPRFLTCMFEYLQNTYVDKKSLCYESISQIVGRDETVKGMHKTLRKRYSYAILMTKMSKLLSTPHPPSQCPLFSSLHAKSGKSFFSSTPPNLVDLMVYML